MDGAIRTKRKLAAVVAGALCAAVGLAGTAQGAAGPDKGPAGARFYDPPGKLPNGHGDLIWQRKAGKLAPVEGARNRLVLYTSKTPKGKTVGVSGVVSVPRGEAPVGGWPVITFAHGTNGIADACAPTRIPGQSGSGGGVTVVGSEAAKWIDAGYAVVRTDYQGLGTPGRHSYLIGTAEGRAVVDIVSAARELYSSIGKHYLISGHSQGGHAALFAAGLADSYAPNLKLAGTVAYAPASHILEQAELLPNLTSPSALSGLAALIFAGAETQSKAIDAASVLSDEALALYPEIAQKCVGELGQTDSFGGLAPSTLLRQGADTGPLFDVLADENPDVSTSAPILILQGEADDTVLPIFTGLLRDELVARGDDVTYSTYPGVGHGPIFLAASQEALDFMQARLPAAP